MVDELTQESFQTGKAIVTVSVDLITAIAEACKRSEEKNPGNYTDLSYNNQSNQSGTSSSRLGTA